MYLSPSKRHNGSHLHHLSSRSFSINHCLVNSKNHWRKYELSVFHLPTSLYSIVKVECSSFCSRCALNTYLFNIESFNSQNFSKWLTVGFQIAVCLVCMSIDSICYLTRVPRQRISCGHKIEFVN